MKTPRGEIGSGSSLSTIVPAELLTNTSSGQRLCGKRRV